ncbi:aldehyde dehydrogenase family protein [Nocardia sp. alder85J]|uniref:aldehyde dehydrogenase family protein n=1 Tax=Nocardia sp. alder85J TaxID=2862949 RepID=UPI001CD313E3|nr:aldehyde dehydrogenase family protein [Nocardia sp. alder85J]MCX4098608.1 aldehyde dehydrogenase family protein [Nocardia sp. alder85J]
MTVISNPIGPGTAAGAGSNDLLEPSATRLRELLDAQRHAFLSRDRLSLSERRDRIDRLLLLLTENADAFGEALNADFGHRPGTVSKLSDIIGELGDIQLTRARLGAWMRPHTPMRGSRLFGVGGKIEQVPLGVVGIIGPWNFPLGLVVEPAAAALAGGNNVMIKFSEVTSRTAALFVEKVAEYFDPTEVVTVTGGSAVGAAFSNLPFDHLFFTGSPKVGALVAEAAGRNLVPVTLELGGKNPVVVDPGADITRAAERIIAGRLMNGGQVCLCPELVFVPENTTAKFIEVALRQAQAIATADGGHVSVVNNANFDRLVDIIDDARAGGATVHEALPGEQPDPTARRIPPVIVTDFDDGMRISEEEIFGPILMVRSYRSIDEVIEYVGQRHSPLAAYWFGPKGAAFHAFTQRVRYGGMTVNDVALHAGIPLLPFGGVGHSGSGAYHGKRGFETFTHTRVTVTSNLPISMGAFVTPPLGRLTGTLIDKILARSAKTARRRLRSSSAV